MLIWLGIALTVVSLLISFGARRPTFAVKLAVLVLGLAGAAVAAERYLAERRDAQDTRDYWEVAHLDAFALHFATGDLQDLTELNTIIGPYVHDRNGQLAWDCTPSSISAYSKAIDTDPRFPFSYFYRVSCARAASTGGASPGDLDTARRIFRITTQIPGHHQNHDEVLRMIDRDDLGHPPA